MGFVYSTRQKKNKKQKKRVQEEEKIAVELVDGCIFWFILRIL